jgi:hypothetical protein
LFYWHGVFLKAWQVLSVHESSVEFFLALDVDRNEGSFSNTDILICS